MKNVYEVLETIGSTTSNNPAVVKLEGITFTTADSVPDAAVGWKTINTAVLAAGEYITLDLSGCTAVDNTITGERAGLGGNAMNIIKDNEYIKGIILPSTLETIGYSAFVGCSRLTNITIPNKVAYIENCAFYWCPGLIGVTFKRSGVTIGNWVFPGRNNFSDNTLRNVYMTHGAGSYTRTAGQSDWAKQ